MTPYSKIAVIGSTGQLGTDLMKAAKGKNLEVIPLSHDEIEITDPHRVSGIIEGTKPGIIINAAAFHQVDKCEEDPQKAFAVNAMGVLNIAKAAKQSNARLITISTDYVFSGEKPAPKGSLTAENSYAETDAANPVNIYGVSKLAGEHLALTANPNTLIVRVASLFGVAGARGKGGNFIEAILNKAKSESSLKVVSDQWMTPTYAKDAAEAILDLAKSDLKGIIHVTNSGATTWHGFAAEAIRQVNLNVAVEPIPSSAYPSKARRPQNSALNTTLLSTKFRPLRHWKEALAAYLKEKGRIGPA